MPSLHSSAISPSPALPAVVFATEMNETKVAYVFDESSYAGFSKVGRLVRRRAGRIGLQDRPD